MRRAIEVAVEEELTAAVGAHADRGALPTEDAGLVLLVRPVVSGQIRLRQLDGWRQIPAMLRDHRRSAA